MHRISAANRHPIPDDLRHAWAMVVVVAALTACGGAASDRGAVTTPTAPPPPPPVAVAAIEITPANTAALRIGATLQLFAVTKSANGTPLNDRVVQWSSSVPTVASVSASGNVTALATGRTVVTATSEGARATATIDVRAAVASLVMTPRVPGPLVPGDTLRLSAAVRDSAGAVLVDRVVAYRSTTPAVATVAADGKVTAVALGTASIVAESEGVSASAAIVVRAPVATVTVSLANPILFPGENRVIRSFALDTRGSTLDGRRAEWSSDNPSVVQVTGTLEGAAVLVAVAPGTATVTVDVEGKRSATIVTVRRLVATIAIASPPASIELGKRAQLTATLRDDQGAAPPSVAVTWRSSDASVASVSGDGRMTALAVGVATISAEADGKRATAAVTVAPLAIRVRTLVAGYAHSCALTTGGETFCWGDNSGGRIGAGDWSSNHLTPMRVAGGLRFVSLEGGEFHTCGLTADGTAHCWGDNWEGRLGIGNNQGSRNTPVPVSTDRRFAQIAGGEGHTCGLEGTGTVWCWGRNDHGQVGDGTAVQRSDPTLVRTAQRFIEIAAGFWHTCGVTTAAEVWCWGHNTSGQLGQGTQAGDILLPTRVKRDAPFARITTGSRSSCALTTDGVPYCWGENSFGVLGTGPGQNVLIPVAVPGVSLTSIELGQSHVCGTTSAQRVVCWGSGVSGQMGTGDLELGQPPTVVSAFGVVRALASGRSHSCAAPAAGGIRCWGKNDYGQLGVGTQSRFSEPVLVPDLTGVRAIVAGAYHSCALTRTNATFCWGDNSSRQLGDGTSATRLRPTRVVDDRGYTAITAMQAGMCGLQADGQVVCWGDGQSAALADTPLRFRELASSSRSYHWCGITTSGRAACARSNWQGQLGNGNTNYSQSPVLVGLEAPFASVQAGGNHACGVTLDGVTYCWGSNVEGQLGLGTRGENVLLPSRVSTTERFRTVAPGPWDTCALNASGAAFCWGADYYGKVGDGPRGGPITTPSAVLGSVRFTSIAMGHDHVCGIATAGTMHCWGGNTFGQFGSGDFNGTDGAPLPAGRGNQWRAVAAGTIHTCGIATDERVYCWGDNSSGAVGQPFPTSPQVVAGNLTVAAER